MLGPVHGERSEHDMYLGSSGRSLRHASLAHARSASSQPSCPATPMASSTGSGGFSSAAGAGGDTRKTTPEAARSSDARTTMAVAVLLVPAGDASPLFWPFPHIFLRLVVVAERNDRRRSWIGSDGRTVRGGVGWEF